MILRRRSEARSTVELPHVALPSDFALSPDFPRLRAALWVLRQDQRPQQEQHDPGDRRDLGAHFRALVFESGSLARDVALAAAHLLLNNETISNNEATMEYLVDVLFVPSEIDVPDAATARRLALAASLKESDATAAGRLSTPVPSSSSPAFSLRLHRRPLRPGSPLLEALRGSDFGTFIAVVSRSSFVDGVAAAAVDRIFLPTLMVSVSPRDQPGAGNFDIVEAGSRSVSQLPASGAPPLPADGRRRLDFTLCMPTAAWYTRVSFASTSPITTRQVLREVCALYNAQRGFVQSLVDPEFSALFLPDSDEALPLDSPIASLELGHSVTTMLEIRQRDLPAQLAVLTTADASCDDGQLLMLPFQVKAPTRVAGPDEGSSGVPSSPPATHGGRAILTCTEHMLLSIASPTVTGQDLIETVSSALRAPVMSTTSGIDTGPDLRFFGLLFRISSSSSEDSATDDNDSLRGLSRKKGPVLEFWLKPHASIMQQIADFLEAQLVSQHDCARAQLLFSEDAQYKRVALAAEALTLTGSESFGLSSTLPLLCNETVMYRDDSVVHSSGLLSVAASEWRMSQQQGLLSNLAFRGTCVLTNYRVIFTPLSRSTELEHAVGQFPLQSISAVTPVMLDTDKRTLTDVQEHAHNLLVDCKDARSLLLGFRTQQLSARFTEALKRCFEGLCFAFHYRSFGSDGQVDPGWKQRYDPWSEFKRLGLRSRPQEGNAFRICSVNENFDVCPTYPTSFIVPAAISDDMIRSIAKYRSKSRIPVVSWVHPEGAALARCAQPRAGWLRTRCADDEELVRSLANVDAPEMLIAGSGDVQKRPVVHLVDARPIANAFANSFKGGGTERATHYASEGIEIFTHFLDIGNIHVVREAYERLLKICRIASASSALGITARRHFDERLQFGDNKEVVDTKMLTEIESQIVHGEASHAKWWSRLEDTGWLLMVSTVLQGSVLVRDLLHSRHQSCLLHCSDGWDRTAQLCSLVQIQLDPFCRTIVGFEQLLEREWIAFGHKFDERLGRRSRGSDNLASKFTTQVTSSPARTNKEVTPADEESPIFLVFMDCVWQVLRQYPTRFQFNEKFLLEIAEHVHSGLYGTFLGNSECERKALAVTSTTTSLWTSLNARIEEFLNPDFKSDDGDQAIRPEASMRCLHLWESYWLRDDPATGSIAARHAQVASRHFHSHEQVHALRTDVERLRSRLADTDRALGLASTALTLEL